MKKIFAIALALVMVLSMASAFAFVGTCGKYEYTCPTVGCGVAKAEVVKFVANNTLDRFAENNNCAGVVVGQPVFFGVKVIFDSDVNDQWFNEPNTKLDISVSNMTDFAIANTSSLINFTGVDMRLTNLTGKTDAADVSGKTYWYNFRTDKLVTTFDNNCIAQGIASNTRAEADATVKYSFSGVTGHTAWLDYGSFQVQVVKDYTDSQFGPVEYGIHVKQGGAEGWFLVIGGKVKYYAEPKTGGYNYYKEVIDNRLIGAVTGQADGTCTDYATLSALIGIKLGDCVTAKTIKAIFGWQNGAGASATWNKDAVAIANAECQVKVEIPKTGDVSVVAYAVMALVAAAGAMGLKK